MTYNYHIIYKNQLLTLYKTIILLVKLETLSFYCEILAFRIHMQ